MKNRREISDISNTLEKHYQACSKLTHKTAYDSIFRSVSRFITLEEALLNQLTQFDCDKNNIQIRKNQFNNTEIFESYGELLNANTSLIKYLTEMIAVIENIEVCSLLSYWTAAMKIENDDIASKIEYAHTIT
ncbi:hypothetical protein [Vibrio nitrifigilis]|uniref:Uncharacterized protein n=1 Tax=Vibrio nitrifigilis TaxID=2789781 RepID=A0ABS0GLE3_9VIBR|nr:hypothetical protein [Vibrio nitrifigilis]MBF9003299.1 hypothetical protein [Vibrio nitrifigilis]